MSNDLTTRLNTTAAACAGAFSDLLHSLRSRRKRSEAAPSYDDLVDLVAGATVAFELTRQYVGYEVLPAVEGWSWFDWQERADAALRRSPR